MYVPPSQSSIICYGSKGGDAVWLGLAERNGSLTYDVSYLWDQLQP